MSDQSDRPDPKADPALIRIEGPAQEEMEVPAVLPVLPLRDAVVYPGVTVPLTVGRSRSVAALDQFIERANRADWSLVILDTDVDTTTAGGRLVANVLGPVAQWEREIIAERTSAALQARKAAGMRLGRPIELEDETRQRIAVLRSEGLSLRAIATQLTDEGRTTARGKTWHASTVRRVIDSLDLDAEHAAIVERTAA